MFVIRAERVLPPQRDITVKVKTFLYNEHSQLINVEPPGLPLHIGLGAGDYQRVHVSTDGGFSQTIECDPATGRVTLR
jgi:hypothetical protein